MRRTYLFVSILFVAAMLLATLTINQRPVGAQVPHLPFQYAVKFVCGKSPGPGQQQVVATGTYFTAINVHNPFNDTVKFRKKIAVALPNEKAGKVSPFFDVALKGDEALEIDCDDIYKHMHMNQTFLKGFVVIESKTELDVVAVYTAAGASGQVETMHVERFPPRRMSPQGLADLIPVPDPKPGVGFCRRDGLKLTITVRNQGTADAPPSVTKVDFSPSGTVSVPTPAISAGGSVDVTVQIPPGCFSPDCNFRITVDSTGLVPESNEGNNTGSGSCLG
ncbi:MAG TPA: CARDB domain-containing protein [Pyrinomonadaceae bacterium]|nr:CARDB domain-containing protein [Pyrinomonadaceae bacterium]